MSEDAKLLLKVSVFILILLVIMAALLPYGIRAASKMARIGVDAYNESIEPTPKEKE